jgi:hypothetical protein
MYHKQTLQKQFLDVNRKLKKRAGKAYQRHIVRFLEVLLILIYLCVRQPSYAPKILGLWWKNTDNSKVCNILIKNRLVKIVA